jgi:integrase
MDPSANLSGMSLICARLKARAAPRRKKHLRLIDPAVIVDEALACYDALTTRQLTTRRCNHARDALMLAFLAYRPLRLASFAALQLEHNLLRTPSGLVLKLDAGEVKEGRPYDCAIPDDLVPYIDHYLSEVRRRLLRGTNSQYLWISMRSTRMSDSTIYYQITKITRRLFGRPLNPHLIRDCVMTALAADAPESVRAGARILGHRDLGTSEEHYNHATAMSAQRRYFQVLRKWRGLAIDKPSEEAAR